MLKQKVVLKIEEVDCGSCELKIKLSLSMPWRSLVFDAMLSILDEYISYSMLHDRFWSMIVRPWTKLTVNFTVKEIITSSTINTHSTEIVSIVTVFERISKAP